VLQRTNELLHPEIPPKMFVTCLCAVLDPASGRLQYANAGHDLPYRRFAGGVEELRAVGMPLGLMPNMHYEEYEITLDPGDSLLFYSDGLVEAHNVQHEMFGFPRLQDFVESYADLGGAELIAALLAELKSFVGENAEQEDDITLVALQRLGSFPSAQVGEPGSESLQNVTIARVPAEQTWRQLAEWNLPSAPGNERLAMESVAQVAHGLQLSPTRLERLKTAVAEATMNAMEHGNRYRVELPVLVQVYTSERSLAVRISDHGAPPTKAPETPDLAAKLAGLQSPRGWGLFLIEKLVDELRITDDQTLHTLELVMHLEGESDADETA
jgi:anti-sigma regulatory factor (Ser/Thr protein kinase)